MANAGAVSTQQPTVKTIIPAGTTFYELALVITGNNAGTTMTADYWADGVKVGSSNFDQIVTAGSFGPYFGVVNGVGCDTVLDVDYYWALTERY